MMLLLIVGFDPIDVDTAAAIQGTCSRCVSFLNDDMIQKAAVGGIHKGMPNQPGLVARMPSQPGLVSVAVNRIGSLAVPSASRVPLTVRLYQLLEGNFRASFNSQRLTGGNRDVTFDTIGEPDALQVPETSPA